MKKEKFSIELYESTKKSGYEVRTTSGNLVEILKTNHKGDYPIIGVVKIGDDKDIVDLFSPTGESVTAVSNNLELLVPVPFDGDFVTLTLYGTRKVIGIVKSSNDRSFEFYCLSNVDEFFNPALVEFNENGNTITVDNGHVKNLEIVTDEDVMGKLLTAIENQGITVTSEFGKFFFDFPKFNVGDKVFGLDGFGSWRLDFYSHKDSRGYVCTGRTYRKIAPFNDYTRNLFER